MGGTVAVFCGSRLGADPAAAAAVAAAGAALARAGWGIVYGGGSRGLMGVLADSALAAGGRAVGVIPDFLVAREVAHTGLNELIVTESMHARKARMAALADAFVALPGGIGTLDETIEMVTWRQLGLHAKPVIVCDVGGWARGLRAALDAAAADGFADAGLVRFVDDVEQLLLVLEAGAVTSWAR